jgi:hypothetical protein
VSSSERAQVKRLHKFKVGQMVDYAPVGGAMATSSRGYKIVQLLPREGTEVLYRIKSPAEVFERVAKEQHLSLKSDSQLGR